MIVGIKEAIKQPIISLMAAAAVFIATLFLNYNIDLTSISNQISGEPAETFYEAQKLTSTVVTVSSGGCLLLTTVIMLTFFIKNYIDTHKKELGILKALGYSNFKIARSFWAFGLPVLIGSALGFAASFLLMGKFYAVQNDGSILPDFSFAFHPELMFCLVILPTFFFSFVSVVYAVIKLRTPALHLITDRITIKRRGKGLAFFVFFGSFCFSAMAQMSFGVRDVADSLLSAMLLVIGLVLAFVTLFLAVSTVIKNNSKTTAIMKVFGYSDLACRQKVLDKYRIIAYIGFAFGTAYQYFLMKLCFSLVFKDMAEIPIYDFDLPVMLISLLIFALAYEAFMCYGLFRIKKTPIKEVMLES